MNEPGGALDRESQANRNRLPFLGRFFFDRLQDRFELFFGVRVGAISSADRETKQDDISSTLRDSSTRPACGPHSFLATYRHESDDKSAESGGFSRVSAKECAHPAFRTN